MQVFELQGELRTDLGKKATNLLRAEGKVPCVLYGGKENVHFSVVEKDLQKLLYTPVVYIVKVNVAGQSYEAVMREIQFHPVSDRVLHMDFYQISEDKPVIMEVPVKLQGFAEGVQAGGKLSLVVRKLKVKAIPANLPGEIVLDVTNLGLGKSIKVKDLSFENFEIVNAKEVVVAQIKLTRAARAAAQHAFLDAVLPACDPLGGTGPRVVRPHPSGDGSRHVGGPRSGRPEVGHRAHFVDFRILRHEASPAHHRRPDQRHAPRDGARRGLRDLRRTSQRLPVDRRCAGPRVALPAEPFEPPRRGRLHP